MSRTTHLLLTLIIVGLAHAQTVNYSYDDAGRLVRAGYPNGKAILYTYDSAGNMLRRLVTTAVAGAAPSATAAGVVNAASFLGGPVAPGEIVTIFGSGIGPATLAGLGLARLGFVDNFRGDTSVFFDGVPAPIIYVSDGQSSVIVPYAVTGKASTQMIVEYQGRRSAPIALAVAPAAPALFSRDATGKGGGAILNENSSLNTPDNPAAKGSIVVLFGTGEGQTGPPGVDGRLASTIFPRPVLPLSVTIGGISSEILYSGAAPGLVAGVFQVNARIPSEAASGNVPIVVRVGTASSQSELTVAVR